MSKKLLSRLDIKPEVLKKLNAAGIFNAQDTLECSEPYLMMTADLSYTDVQSLVSLVASFSSPRDHTAANIFSSRKSSVSFLPLRLPKIDRLLGGGLSRGAISEVVGPAGVGKTQLCLTLTAVTGLAQSMGGLGEGTGVLYFDTEGKFSAQRLVEIAQAQAPLWFGRGKGEGGGLFSQSQDSSNHNLIIENDLDRGDLSCNSGHSSNVGHHFDDHAVHTARVVELLERTHVIPVENSEDFLQRLDNIETILIEHRIGLIVIDSIADLVRKDPIKMRENGHQGSKADNISRTSSLISIAATLKKLADAFQLVVFITNQITGNVNFDNNSDNTTAVDYFSSNHHNNDSASNISCSQAPAQLTIISGSSNNLAMTSSIRSSQRGHHDTHKEVALDDNGATPSPLAYKDGVIPVNDFSVDSTGISMKRKLDTYQVEQAQTSLGANVIPALGNAWHHCVSTRLVLEQFEHHRTITIAKSPIAAKESGDFDIGIAGLVEIQ